MSAYLIPHPPATVEQMRQAVADWQAAAAHERFCITHGLCCGSTITAQHNATLYEATASGIQREIDARLAAEQHAAAPQVSLPLFDGANHAE